MSAAKFSRFVALCIGLTLTFTACSGAPQGGGTPAESNTTDPAPLPTAPEPPSPSPSDEPLALTPDPSTVKEIATGLDAPWAITFVGSSALMSERDTGKIIERTVDGKVRVAGVVPGVHHGGEGGLLGIVTRPQTADTGFKSAGNISAELFVYSTGTSGNRIQRFELSGQPGALSLGQGTTLVDQIPAAGNHNGGRLAFGPDSMLYATTGDAGQGQSSQDLDSLAGKILRMTPNGEVPTDNPFPGSLVFSYGHRNPQGLSWAPDGTMFASEFGQNTWDELNIIRAGSNYGWPIVEGITGSDQFVDPVQQWNPSQASPSGMAQTGNTLFIANLRGQTLRAVHLATLDQETSFFNSEYGRIRDVVAAPDGLLWFLTNNTDGRGAPNDGDDKLISVELIPVSPPL